MSDELTPEQVTKIGATGCATAWADYIWREMMAGVPMAVLNATQLRDCLAPLLNGLNADCAARLTAATTAGDVPAGDVPGGEIPHVQV